MLNKLKTQKGFTLIELMIVVAIIGILAAIAIPNFLRYQLKSKTAEAKTNIGAIKTSQEAYRAENDFYAVSSLHPNSGTVSVQGAKQDWGTPTTGNGWEEIGYRPVAKVYYVYGVMGAGTTADTAVGTMAAGDLFPKYAITAMADLDTDTTNGEYGFTTDTDNDGTPDITKGTHIKGIITKIGAVEELVPGQF